jgi:hydrogenase/urease accessory protein HupE
MPLSFVAMMIVGGAFGMTGMELPFVEVGIGLSVVILGVAVAVGLHHGRASLYRAARLTASPALTWPQSCCHRWQTGLRHDPIL